MTRLEGHLSATLARVASVRPQEVGAALWAFAYFFCLLSSYYILRPLRDEMGVAAGVENLHLLFTATFFAMLAAMPVFGAVVARFPRRVFVPWVYRFFVLNILIFFALLTWTDSHVHVARAFFVWVSVFNLFVVTVFWSFMADLFSNAQGKRLFGFIAAGGTVGALLGPTLTATLAVPLGPVNLLLVSAVLLELAVWCVFRLLRRADDLRATAHTAVEEAPVQTAAAPAESDGKAANEAVIGGGIFAGLLHVLRNVYLLMISGHILFLTVTATFLYFMQAEIVAGAFDDPAERTRMFALIDLAVGLATLLVQIFATGRLIRRFGVATALSFTPVVTLLGFLALALSPVLVVIVAFQALRRAADFAVTNPAREILFTVVPREDKYKSKNFLDTAVFRGGDLVGAWIYRGLKGMGLDLAGVAVVAVPLAAAWMALVVFLGRKQDELARAPTPDAAGHPAARPAE